jgi:tetratricopeptide (TPR) repeat protein
MKNRLRRPLLYVISILIVAIVALIGLMIKDVFLEKSIPQNPAEQAFSQANALVQKDPKNAEYLYERAKAHRDLGRTNSAIKDLEQAIRLRPSAPMLHYTIAQIYMDESNDDKAVQELKNELQITENRNELAWLDLGRIYNQHKDYAQAIYCLNNALVRMKTGADVHFELGKAYQSIGKYNLAAKEYRTVLSLTPDDGAAEQALRKILPKTTVSPDDTPLKTETTNQNTPSTNNN